MVVFAAASQGDFSVLSDFVFADAPVSVGVVLWCGFFACGVGLLGCCSVAGSVWSLGVVVGSEFVELGL